jgi:hypothetical protein
MIGDADAQLMAPNAVERVIGISGHPTRRGVRGNEQNSAEDARARGNPTVHIRP